MNQGQSSALAAKETRTITFSGPLPPPSLLSGYESACPGAADRIIRMAEQEAEHRRVTETAIVQAGAAELKRESEEAKRGQIFALLIVILSIGGCIFLASCGHEVAASALGLGAVGSVVTTFIIGRGLKAADDKSSEAGSSQVEASPHRRKLRT